MPRRTLSLLMLVSLMAALLAACGQATAPAPTTAPAANAPTAAPSGGEATAAPAGAEATAPAAAPTTSDALLTLSPGNSATFQRNFNPLSSTHLQPTINGVYEPLMIINSATGELVPWLATEYAWGDDNTTLTFTLREGVLWSDGEPFTAGDVAYTFNLLKGTSGLFSNANVLPALTGESAYIESVEATDDTTVVFTFNRIYTPGLYDLIKQNIVPEHVWSEIADPVKATNDNPVGTGPFTEVADFQNQTYTLTKNPNYWQAGKPAIAGVRYLAFPDRNAMNLAMVDGQLDWANGQIPNTEQAFVAKDPEHFSYINASGPNMATLALQTSKAPFDDVNVRKAISMAINREQIAMVGESGIATPADVTGLVPFYQSWKVEDPASLGDWATYNPEQANQLLDAAGLAKGADGIRALPDGTKMQYELPLLPLPNWIADMQIVAENLKEVGIAVTVKPVEFPEWQQLQQTGTYDMMFNIVDGDATPYRFFNRTMSSDLLMPVGEPAQGNSTRYDGGAADELLAQFASTADEAEQHEIARELQRVFAEEVPTLPLFPLSGQGFINTNRLTGFPTREDYYASAEPNPSFFADFLIVTTRLQPK